MRQSSKKNNHRVLDDDLINQIAASSEEEQTNWLFLTPHSRFSGRWYVDAIDQSFFIDFEEIVGKYRTVSPASLKDFLDHSNDLGYNVAFTESPESILSAWGHLNDIPSFKLNSDMANSLRERGMNKEADVVDKTGMLPFQLQGFNYLKDPRLKGGLAAWSTGVGKTALKAALIKQHLEVDKEYQLALVVVKSNNKIDTQRKLRQLGSLESFIIDGTPKKRKDLYSLFNDILSDDLPLIGITNYEKFREDTSELAALVEGRNVVIFWDEMPTKLSNRRTILYDSVRTVLYDQEGKNLKWSNIRPNKLRQYDLSATPIQNDPTGLLNQFRLLDPDVFPTISEWDKKFVASRNFFTKEPETFKNLDEMGLMIEFMTHQVDKEDPDIAQMFPEVLPVVRYIDWHPSDRAIYNKLQDIAADLVRRAKEDSSVKKLNVLQLIGVLQMLCDAPSMVQKSAQNRQEFEQALEDATSDEEIYDLEGSISGSEAALLLLQELNHDLSDDTHTKIEALREIICDKHPNEKIVVFSRLASYIQPVLESFFQKWGVSYVIYRGTDKQRLEAKDKFRSDPSVRVFLSSDAGSDSIDLPEASVSVDYDQPMLWTTKTQRRNRIHRVNSTHKSVTHYTLIMVNSVEERIDQIINKKHGYHIAVFKQNINESAISARMTAEDLWYIITGEYED